MSFDVPNIKVMLDEDEGDAMNVGGVSFWQTKDEGIEGNKDTQLCNRRDHDERKWGDFKLKICDEEEYDFSDRSQSLIVAVMRRVMRILVFIPGGCLGFCLSPLKKGRV